MRRCGSKCFKLSNVFPRRVFTCAIPRPPTCAWRLDIDPAKASCVSGRPHVTRVEAFCIPSRAAWPPRDRSSPPAEQPLLSAAWPARHVHVHRPSTSLASACCVQQASLACSDSALQQTEDGASFCCQQQTSTTNVVFPPIRPLFAAMFTYTTAQSPRLPAFVHHHCN